jgi:hypothetical protein
LCLTKQALRQTYGAEGVPVESFRTVRNPVTELPKTAGKISVLVRLAIWS